MRVFRNTLGESGTAPPGGIFRGAWKDLVERSREGEAESLLLAHKVVQEGAAHHPKSWWLLDHLAQVSSEVRGSG